MIAHWTEETITTALARAAQKAFHDTVKVSHCADENDFVVTMSNGQMFRVDVTEHRKET